MPGFKRLMGDAIVDSVSWQNHGPVYNLKFDDGEIAENISREEIQKSASNRTRAVLRWKKGGAAVKAVAAFGDKKWGAYRRMSSIGLEGAKRRGSGEVSPR